MPQSVWQNDTLRYLATLLSLREIAPIYRGASQPCPRRNSL